MTNKTEFKVGDKVKYKAGHVGAAELNYHEFNKVYTIKTVYSDTVKFEESDNCCMIHRLELVNSNRHPHADLIIQWANDQSLKIQFRESADKQWLDVIEPNWLTCYEYRIKPKTKTVARYQYSYQAPKSKATHVTDLLTLAEWEDLVQSIGLKKAVRLEWTREEIEIEIE